MLCSRFVHTAEVVTYDNETEETEKDAAMNEFLSRFVWIMRTKLVEVHTDCDKKTIDAMLLISVEKVVSEMEKDGLHEMSGSGGMSFDDFSEDLWRTVWDVMNVVVEDMGKAKKTDKLKGFVHADKVKEMCRFAGEVGIRGYMLRELSGHAKRISNDMQFAGIQPSRESCTLLMEAFVQTGCVDDAKESFANMIKLGHKPDDRSMASLLAAYKKENSLDTAFDLFFDHDYVVLSSTFI